ncbi:hypothetical protein Bca4012_079899 [Brassica carinata]
MLFSLGCLSFICGFGIGGCCGLCGFDAFGGPWFCISGRTPCMCSGVGLLGTMFIQSEPICSALSGIWSVLASSVDLNLTLLSLGIFLWSELSSWGWFSCFLFQPWPLYPLNLFTFKL